MRRGYYAVFWDAYLPHGRHISPDVMAYAGGGWTNLYQRWPNSRP